MAAQNRKPTAPAKARTSPEPLSAPVVAPDTAFTHQIISIRDSAVVAGQALQNDRVAREEFYAREQARLNAARDAELLSLDTQIAQQSHIVIGCDGALEALENNTIVQFKRSA